MFSKNKYIVYLCSYVIAKILKLIWKVELIFKKKWQIRISYSDVENEPW